MRLVAGFIVFLCFGATVRAQQQSIAVQEIERAKQLLSSPSWADKAWGAYFAGRLHSKELEQPLIEQFRAAASVREMLSYSEAHAFVSALFDAAIESGITVPASLLEPFEKNWPDPVVILLARDRESSEAEDVLMRFRVNEARSSVWLAANNLLFERKSERWYAAVLGEVTITHRLCVTDPNRGPSYPGGSFGGVHRDGVAAMPRGFPPVGLYVLEDTPERGSVLLARGPRDAHYRRTVVPLNGQVGTHSNDRYTDRMETRIGYLGRLGGLSAQEAQRLFRAQTHIVYTNVTDFERQARQALDAQEHGIRKLIQDIAERGLHAPGARLVIVPEIVDSRASPDSALPQVEVREIELP